MFYKLLTLFRILLYSEPAFFIKKVTSINYFVAAKNGLNAEITIRDRFMFVKAWSDRDYVAFYYCTPMKASDDSFDRFVIDNIKNSIVFILPTEKLRSYVNNYSECFEKFSTPEFPVINAGGSILDKFGAHSEDEKKIYTFIKLDGTRYPIIYFTKKRIIKNVFRYNLKVVKRKDTSTIKKISYLVDGNLFDISNIDSFYSSKINHSSMPRVTAWMMFNNINCQSDKTIGFDNQLFKHNENISKCLNLEDIWLLRTENKEFCLFEKNRKHLTLSYITRPRMNSSEDKKEIMVTLTYHKGKIKKKTQILIPDESKRHEMAISNQVMVNIDTLRLTKPSKSILDRLRSLEISTNLPLNPDDLTVLDMFEI